MKINLTHRLSPDGKIIISGTLPELPKIACYDGNVLIKKSGVLIEYEHWQIEEIAKCATDIEYFASNYVYVVDPDQGKILITLRDYQKKLLNHLFKNRFSVLLASRQIGKSLCASIFMLHYVLFNKDKKAVILANKAVISKEIFQKIRTAYEKLPFWLQIGVVEWQKTTCRLENGSGISSEATTAEGLRGITANCILLDEFAFIDRNIADEFFASMYPTISASKESKIIIVSTPNGLNLFHELWSKAIRGKNSFAPLRVDYHEVEGRDENWKDETIKNIGLRRFNQEYGNNFIGSTATLIKSTLLEQLESKEPIAFLKDNLLKIWEFPKKGRTYVLGCDTAKGTGSDYSVAQVIDITAYPFKQVAIYRSNLINTRAFGEVIVEVANKYNTAWVMVENNDIGQAVIDYLWEDVEYENLVNYSPLKKREIGIRSTRKTKPLANDLLQLLVEEGKLTIVDTDTIYELSKYIEVKPGVFKADTDENDDCVTSLLWALFILKTNYLDNDGIKDEKVEEKLKESDSDEDEESDVLDGEPIDMFIK
jgi:hypothetical protein